MKQRAVVDTSTLVSAALRAESKPRRALEQAILRFELCLSEQLLSELELVLARPQFARYVSAEAARAFIASICAEGGMFSLSAEEIGSVERPCRDAEDDHILALARIAEASLIVTSDYDLLVLHPWQGISILTPVQFLAQFPD